MEVEFMDKAIKCEDCKNRVWDYYLWWCVPRSIAHPENKGVWAFCKHAKAKRRHQ